MKYFDDAVGGLFKVRKTKMREQDKAKDRRLSHKDEQKLVLDNKRGV